MKAQWFRSVEDIGVDRWQQAIGNTCYPFACFDFHKALEKSQSIGDGSGWYPEYLLIMDDNDTALAVVPSYLKTHSQGEFVFDHAWAEAYQRHGLSYYPKRVWAIPFSPVTGPRIFSCLDDEVVEQLYPTIAGLMTEADSDRDFSSWHLLFTQPSVADSLANEGFLTRISCQFHWFNQNYSDMESYFESFSSRKRKAARKERRKVAEQGVRLERRLGHQVSSQEIDLFYLCYQSTYAKRGQRGYLSHAFFSELIRTMPERILLVLAYKGEQAIAASWCFYDEHSLYGRYWGCIEEVDCLHFEACYYQGIEFCLEKGLQHFDPGTQGEHKIARGFQPVFSHSVHYIRHEGFRGAIEQFCREEAEMVREYHQDTHSLLPFKHS